MNTTARLRQIASQWYSGYESSTAPLVEAIVAEFVLIPRTELPKVIERKGAEILVTDSESACVHYLGKDGWDVSRHRADAYARLALAEAIDARNAEQEAAKAAKAAELAADTAKLDAEALALFNAAWESEAAEMPGVASEKFRRLALAARRIHGVTK